MRSASRKPVDHDRHIMIDAILRRRRIESLWAYSSGRTPWSNWTVGGPKRVPVAGRFVLVEGEAGVGKTTLLDDLARRERERRAGTCP
jgi:hypothetical protein